jgi:hypothetical protein
MGFLDIEDFISEKKCFNLLLNTDGFSFTAHFDRPTLEVENVLVNHDDIVVNGKTYHIVS